MDTKETRVESLMSAGWMKDNPILAAQRIVDFTKKYSADYDISVQPANHPGMAVMVRATLKEPVHG
jgi:hypothetical protein